MPTPTPPAVATPFAVAGGYNTIPVASQIGVTPGAASFTDGFPPLTRTQLASGGIPPAGLDMNGILFMLSSHIAWLHAGGFYRFSADVVAAYTGYAVGAIIQSAIDPTQFFYNTVADNVNDPDVLTTGWAQFSPYAGSAAAQSETLAPGATTDLPLGNGVGFLELNPSTGAATLGGVLGGTQGQLLTISNINGSYPVTLLQLDLGSSASARFRLASDITLLQYGSITLRKSPVSSGFWIPA
jgi:hypothetical protein